MRRIAHQHLFGRHAPSSYPWLLGLATQLVIEPTLGTPYLTVSAGLRDFVTWSDQRRRAWQRQRLEAILGHARSRVPYYRALLAAGPRSEELRLTDLPIVNKTLMRGNLDQFASEGWRGMRYVSKRTGGTSGDPFAYPLDKDAWTQIYGASLHQYEQLGYRYGERMLLLGAPTSLGLEQPDVKSRVRHWLERHVTELTGYEVDQEASTQRARAAGAARATLWYGYAGTVAAMADAVLDRGLCVEPPRAIVVTAEPLLPGWRASIERAFPVPLRDQYGCNDGGLLSQSCSHGRYHVAENVSIVEILDEDGLPSPPGVEGDVTVTNLHARVLPFLRYQIGDRAVIAEGECGCGVRGQTIERLEGRVGDRITLPTGQQLSGRAFGLILGHTRGVRAWQVVQTNPQTVKVRLAVDRNFGQRQAALLRASIAEQCKHSVTVELTTEEPFERTRGGKHKVVIAYEGS